ncbi:hypothetical protein ACG2F4_02015 [Halalkalibaculum sp. DA3122]|uniref:hypothetical protein n=1 Tax=Halalkalibaculum sp. DA3122 TaxID=3373607 RepID=UPI003755126B
MKRFITGVLILCTYALFAGCGNTLSPFNSGSADKLCFSSFESKADTSGWQSFAAFNIRNETPPAGGEKSVYIAGGCLYPHALLEIPGIGKSLEVELRLWGKTLVNGGNVVLTNTGTGKRISVTVTDSSWTEYQSAGKLAVNKNDRLELSMSSGGDHPGRYAGRPG